MTATEPTSGPWKASQTYPLGDWCIHAAGIPWQLAYLSRSTQIEWPLEANARLIAAAPDMLEALMDIVVLASPDGSVAKLARAAIAKARA